MSEERATWFPLYGDGSERYRALVSYRGLEWVCCHMGGWWEIDGDGINGVMVVRLGNHKSNAMDKACKLMAVING